MQPFTVDLLDSKESNHSIMIEAANYARDGYSIKLVIKNACSELTNFDSFIFDYFAEINQSRDDCWKKLKTSLEELVVYPTSNPSLGYGSFWGPYQQNNFFSFLLTLQHLRNLDVKCYVTAYNVSEYLQLAGHKQPNLAEIIFDKIADNKYGDLKNIILGQMYEGIKLNRPAFTSFKLFKYNDSCMITSEEMAGLLQIIKDPKMSIDYLGYFIPNPQLAIEPLNVKYDDLQYPILSNEIETEPDNAHHLYLNPPNHSLEETFDHIRGQLKLAVKNKANILHIIINNFSTDVSFPIKGFDALAYLLADPDEQYGLSELELNYFRQHMQKVIFSAERMYSRAIVPKIRSLKIFLNALLKMTSLHAIELEPFKFLPMHLMRRFATYTTVMLPKIEYLDLGNSGFAFQDHYKEVMVSAFYPPIDIPILCARYEQHHGNRFKLFSNIKSLKMNVFVDNHCVTKYTDLPKSLENTREMLRLSEDSTHVDHGFCKEMIAQDENNVSWAHKSHRF